MTRLFRLLRRAAAGALPLFPLALLLASPSRAQETGAPVAKGKVVGRVVDSRTGLGITDVGVQVVGTAMGAQTGFDGRFAIANVPAGTITIQVRRLGYQPKSVTGLMLPPGGALEETISMDAATVQLSEQVVTAAAERGSVNEALDAQRRATGIVNAVTSEQIQRSPDSDAAQAVQRVSGVTVQDGKYVFVRGLGERYTTTSLNGARIPSPEPERKVVPLDLFPAALLQSVTTSKNFTPDQPGDFSGALVDLRTREFPAQRVISYSVSVGYNDRATGKPVLGAPTEGMEWLGFGGGARSLPGIVSAAGNFSSSPTQEQYNQMIKAFRNAWSVKERSGSPNSSMSISVGGNDPLFGRNLGYVGSLSYAYTQEVRSDEVRAFAIPVSDGQSMTTAEVDRYEGSTGRESVLWGGLFNVSTLLGTRHRVSLNNTYSRSADNDARFEQGMDENSGLPFRIQRLRFVERSVWSSQLATEHQLGARERLDLSVTGSRVTRVEPDRSEAVYAIDEPGGAPFLFGGSEGAVRTYGELAENSIGSSADFSVRFGEPGREHLLKIGGLGRYTHRDAANDSYSLQATLPREERELSPEQIFGQFAEPGSSVFRVVPLSQGGSYEASDFLGAGYGMLEYQLSERLRLVGGARVEYSGLEVIAQPLFGAAVTVRPRYTDALPSAALNVRLTDAQNLRLSVSQTLARPEYRELVGINQRDVIGGELFRGNPDLRRTLIRNADVRWEWYPQAGEVLSVGVFAKQFEDPIERVYRGTSGTRVTTFENAEGANNFGAEVEMRKGLGFAAEALESFTVFTNATVMSSEIELARASSGSVQEKRAMVGQAPYVVNAGLTYATAGGGTSATVLYNVVGRRIFAASLLPLPSVYEQPRQVIDLSVRFPVWSGVSAKLDAKNLLDAPYEVTQGTVTREFYRTGRTFAAGLTWRP